MVRSRKLSIFGNEFAGFPFILVAHNLEREYRKGNHYRQAAVQIKKLLHPCQGSPALGAGMFDFFPKARSSLLTCTQKLAMIQTA